MSPSSLSVTGLVGGTMAVRLMVMLVSAVFGETRDFRYGAVSSPKLLEAFDSYYEKARKVVETALKDERLGLTVLERLVLEFRFGLNGNTIHSRQRTAYQHWLSAYQVFLIEGEILHKIRRYSVNVHQTA